MKLFLIKFIKYFLIPVILISISLEILIRNIPNSYTFKLNIIEKNKEDVELLIMGTSHTHNGINPKYISIKTLNLASGGQGVTVDDFLIERYIKYMPKIKYIILPIDYQTLFMPDAYGSPHRYMYYNVYYKFEPKIFSVDNYEIFHPASVKMKLDSLLHNCLKPIDDSLGFATRNVIDTSGAEETVSWQTIDDFSNDTVKKNVNAFNHIANFTEENNKELIIITMPVHNSFASISSTKQISFSDSVIRNVMKNHKNCTYLNYYNIPLSDSCFQDATHLNLTGSEKFTRILAHDLDSLGILKQ